MTTTTIPFVLHRKPGTLIVDYETNQSAAQSGFDLFAGNGFDMNLCVGYPTMRAYINSYEGTGYAAACAWIQIVTRREFISTEAAEPEAILSGIDTHPVLAASGVPFFAFGFPAEIFDAPCDNLNGFTRLDWIADTFLVTLPSRATGYSISRAASFRWGYCEYDLNARRQVEISPLIITDQACWIQHLPLLRSKFSHWKYSESDSEN